MQREDQLDLKMNHSCITSKNTWKTRNDSSNVSAILAPKNYERNSGRPLIKPNKPNKTTICSLSRKTLSPLPIAHCETCYCRQTPQPPLINLNPQPCIETEKTCPQAQRKIKSARDCHHYITEQNDDDVEDGNRSARSEKFLKEVHRKVNYIPRTVFLTRLKEEAHKDCRKPCCGGGFTRRREDYEELARLREENQRQRTLIDDDLTSPRLRGGDDVCKIDCDCSKCEDKKTLIENTKKVSAIKEFRNENYFETHSSSDLLKEQHQDVGDHQCVHRFVLDERMIPVPENPDAYGLSRCAICNNPMTEVDLSKKTVDSRLKMKQSKGTIVEKEFKGLVSLEPKRLHVPMKDEKVEVKIPIGLQVEDELRKFKKFMRPVPVSSVALRYQKGVM